MMQTSACPSPSNVSNMPQNKTGRLAAARLITQKMAGCSIHLGFHLFQAFHEGVVTLGRAE